MAIKADIEKQRRKLEKTKESYLDAQFVRKLYSTCCYAGLAGFAYLGLRALCGGNIIETLKLENPKNLVQFLDQASAVIGILSSVTGLAALAAYVTERKWKKDIKNEEKQLDAIVEDYKFSRGHR